MLFNTFLKTVVYEKGRQLLHIYIAMSVSNNKKSIWFYLIYLHRHRYSVTGFAPREHFLLQLHFLSMWNGSCCSFV